MGTYYLFDRNSNPGRWIENRYGDDTPPVDWYHWRQGMLLPQDEVIPNPIRFSLKPQNPWASDHGPHKPSYLRAAAPLFHDDLIAALRACGVDNLQTYAVALFDPDNQQVYTDYKAVNIVGMLRAVDMGKSNATIQPNGPALIDVDFDGFTIDENKTYGQLLFRLAESSNGIIVHEKVRDFLLERGFTDLAFYEPELAAL